MKKILVALVMLALVFGSAAALEAALTVEIKVDALSIEKKGESDIITVGSIDQTKGGNGSGEYYDSSTVNFSFKDDDGLYGGQIQFDIAGTVNAATSGHFGSMPALADPIFANLNAWIMLGEYVKVTAGRIQSNPTARLNAIIDEQHLGPMVGSQGVEHGFRTDHLIYTSARDLELMADFYLGKFFDQDYTITGAVFHTAGVNFDGSDDTSGGDGMVITGVGARFSGTLVPDLLKLNLTYSWRKIRQPTLPNATAWADYQNSLGDSDIVSYASSAGLSSNGQQYRNNFGLYAQVTPMDALKLTAGYGLSLRVIPLGDKGSLPDPSSYVPTAGTPSVPGRFGTYAPVKDFSKSSDMFHGIDVRADFAVTDTILIEGQLNVSFGEQVLRYTTDTGAAATDVKYEQGTTYFGIFGGLGAAIGFTDTLSFGIGATIWADNFTAVSKAGGSAVAGADGIVTASTVFGVEGTLAYAVSKNAEARIGLKFTAVEVKVDGERDDSAYPETRFSIPVGITVKF